MSKNTKNTDTRIYEIRKAKAQAERQARADALAEQDRTWREMGMAEQGGRPEGWGL